MFLPDLALKFQQNININKYTIESIQVKYLFYISIHTCNLIELETLKAYLKTY